MAERISRPYPQPWAALGARLATWTPWSARFAPASARWTPALALPPAAVLADASGARISLTLRGYQFPGATAVDEANWLLVSLRADDGHDAWTATQPVLLTWEVVHLIGWLRAVAGGGTRAASIDFTEPDLALSAAGAGDAALLSVDLTAGFGPAWRPPYVATTVRLRPSADDLWRCADALAEALARFPIREGQGRRPGRW